jgi:hypothetical protein
MDNSPVHKRPTSTEIIASLRLALTSHRPYSPDFAPSDFFLFGGLTEKMLGIDFGSPRELMDWIQSAFEAIPRSFLDELFKSWLRRLEDCINSKGAYINA